jgi:hypothetical protein
MLDQVVNTDSAELANLANRRQLVRADTRPDVTRPSTGWTL